MSFIRFFSFDFAKITKKPHNHFQTNKNLRKDYQPHQEKTVKGYMVTAVTM